MYYTPGLLHPDESGWHNKGTLNSQNTKKMAKLPLKLRRRLVFLKQFAGYEPSQTRVAEKLVSGLGAFLGILAVCVVSSISLGGTDRLLVVASMGATAVLLFAVPQGPLSQPWALMAGHFVSAVVGLLCAHFLGHGALAAALAVGLAVAVMYLANCIHPPGGATALTAVLGGEHIQALGFWYMINPVLINTLAILAVALLFNALFSWRRYPNYFVRKRLQAKPASTTEQAGGTPLTHEDFSAALAKMDSYVDVSPEVLAQLFEYALAHSEDTNTHPQALQIGAFYNNGQLGQRWCVRQVLDMSPAPLPRLGGDLQVIYKNVAGADLYQTGLMPHNSFKRWARYQVQWVDGRWLPVAQPPA